MEVILCQDVPKIGQVGEVVKVKDGFARNFLIPQKLAYVATKNNLNRIEREKKKKAEQHQQAKQEAVLFAEKLGKISLTISVEVNDLDKLYGSVSEGDILKALEAEGQVLERRQILIDKPINELGIFEVGIHLHSEVTAKIRVWVTKK